MPRNQSIPTAQCTFSTKSIHHDGDVVLALIVMKWREQATISGLAVIVIRLSAAKWPCGALKFVALSLGHASPFLWRFAHVVLTLCIYLWRGIQG